MLPLHTDSPPSQEALQSSLPMNPTRIPNDMVFLERHVTEICKGRVPPLVGPYAIPVLSMGLKAHTKAHFKCYDKQTVEES